MPHGDLAQVAAVLGAVGSLLVLLPRRRGQLLAGFAVLSVAEALLAIALIPRSDLSRLHRPLILAGLVVIAAVVIALAVVLVRRPTWTPFVLLLAAPFRIPVNLGSQHAFLLLPLYGVLAAAGLAFCWRLASAEPRPVTALLTAPVGAFIALSGLSLLWSRDLKQGSIELVFFLFPFAAMFSIVARTPFAAWLPRVLAVTLVTLTSVFAVIGLFQRATHRLFYAPSLEVENAFTSYFRVSSVFKDPSLFGRYLAVGTAVLVAALLLGRIQPSLAVPLLAVNYVALWFSYSQSSMVTIFAVVATLSMLVGRPGTRRVVGVVTATVVLTAGAVVADHVRHHSARKFTSDRSRLVSVTLKVARNHPLVGVGVGAQPKASREEAAHHTQASRNRSHTTPLTVAAELGLLGVVAYVSLLLGAGRAFSRAYRLHRAFGLGAFAVFLTLVIHSLFYAGFFEDPLSWGALAATGSLLNALPRQTSDSGLRLNRQKVSVA